jgi:hypothetical protein
MAAGFVDPAHLLDGAVRRIHLGNYVVQDRAYLSDDPLVRFALWIDRQHVFASRVEDYLAERNGPQLASSRSNHGIS